MKPTIIITAALMTVMGTPVLAQVSYRPANDGGPMSPPTSTMTAPAPTSTQARRIQSRRMSRAGEGAYAAAPEERTVTTRGLYENGDYVGWDPDPNIRFQLLRDPKGAGSQ